MLDKLLERYSKAYYEGNPLISNEEYDALERMHGQIVGGQGDINHLYKMYSLQKHYDEDGEYPLVSNTTISDYIKTPKYDGAAISLIYHNGNLIQALTRGDGEKGRDILKKVLMLGIPTSIEIDGLVQVTGEVVARSDVPNSRNYASGALNLKSADEFLQRKTDGNLIFLAYGIQVAENRQGSLGTYLEDMQFLVAQGFTSVVQFKGEDYPKDGEVFRLNNNAKFNAAGFTAKFPRGAFAHKEEQEFVTTKLLDVIWATGKSGKVTPTAILETVMIGDANISRATLNNIAYIEALGLGIGDTVKVIRSGEIIPKIIGKL